ncbi:MAG: histidine decarboxylase, pyruvoyl type [Patescibacteria group bacterium]
MNDTKFLSPYDQFCRGIFDSDHYVVALNLVAAKIATDSDGAFHQLDGIAAFDGAENAQAYMGQINMITVSSFCAPQALIWGHHLATVVDEPDSKHLLDVEQWDGQRVPVHSANGLIRATTSLFGTADQRLFPLAPGTHCPTACKTVVSNKPGLIYALVGIGVSQPNSGSASIFMEDADYVAHDDSARLGLVREQSITVIAESVMTIAKNQKTKCDIIYASYVELEIGEGEAGCAGVFIPYITLAKKAVPPGGIEELRKLNLNEWQRAINIDPSEV